jgi:hypothetical protein
MKNAKITAVLSEKIDRVTAVRPMIPRSVELPMSTLGYLSERVVFLLYGATRRQAKPYNRRQTRAYRLPSAVAVVPRCCPILGGAHAGLSLTLGAGTGSRAEAVVSGSGADSNQPILIARLRSRRRRGEYSGGITCLDAPRCRTIRSMKHSRGGELHCPTLQPRHTAGSVILSSC